MNGPGNVATCGSRSLCKSDYRAPFSPHTLLVPSLNSLPFPFLFFHSFAFFLNFLFIPSSFFYPFFFFLQSFFSLPWLSSLVLPSLCYYFFPSFLPAVLFSFPFFLLSSLILLLHILPPSFLPSYPPSFLPSYLPSFSSSFSSSFDTSFLLSRFPSFLRAFFSFSLRPFILPIFFHSLSSPSFHLSSVHLSSAYSLIFSLLLCSQAKNPESK